MANQLSRIGVGTTGGMTRTPADGVNAQQRTNMQLSVNAWNQVWPAMPIRSTPSASRPIPLAITSGKHYPPVTNKVLVNTATRLVNVTPPVTVAIPDGGGTGIKCCW